ncbi:MAG: hypothetical protein JNK82_40230, partial [Myxococcaceae bacterium]|nr:hypothetical protein [Myxococcaceae bacterium]
MLEAVFTVLSLLLAMSTAVMPLRVAVLPLPGPKGQELGERLAERLATGGGGIDVMSPAAVATQLDEEQLGKLMGCNGGRECLRSGGEALAADYL